MHTVFYFKCDLWICNGLQRRLNCVSTAIGLGVSSVSVYWRLACSVYRHAGKINMHPIFFFWNALLGHFDGDSKNKKTSKLG